MSTSFACQCLGPQTIEVVKRILTCYVSPTHSDSYYVSTTSKQKPAPACRCDERLGLHVSQRPAPQPQVLHPICPGVPAIATN